MVYMDVLTKEQRRKNMQHIKGKNTSIEVRLCKALWQKGYHYRKNYKKLPGSPDIVLTKYKIAIFSAGSVGQSYYKQLRQLENIEVVLWVDNYKYGDKIEGMMITHPDSLKEIFWDYVLIAVKKRKIADEIRGCLLKYGVTERKILYQEPEIKSELYKFYIKE